MIFWNVDCTITLIISSSVCYMIYCLNKHNESHSVHKDDDIGVITSLEKEVSYYKDNEKILNDRIDFLTKDE